MAVPPGKTVGIIGGGVAGVVAAVSLATRGYQPVLFAPGPGADIFFSGAVDVAGDPERVPRWGHKANRNVRTNLLQQIRRGDAHPYHTMALVDGTVRDERLMERLDEALNFLRAQLSFTGYLLSGQAMLRQKGYVTAIGTVKEASLLHAAHAGWSVDELDNANVLVLGVDRMADHDPDAVIRVLTGLCGERLPKGAKFQPGRVRLDLMPESQNLLGFHVARHLDSPEGAEQWLKEIVRLTKGKSYTHLLLPPVMGLATNDTLMAKTTEAAGVPVAEALGVQSSVPGWRFHEALRRLVEFHEIKTVAHPVTRAEIRGNAIIGLHAGGEFHEADAAVLTTGRFLSGGLARDAEIREPLFDIPVFHGDTPVRHHTNLELSNANPMRRQPIFEVGVRVDEQMRPLDAGGHPVFTNLYAAGSILAGSDYGVDQAGVGMAAATGHHVARRIAGE